MSAAVKTARKKDQPRPPASGLGLDSIGDLSGLLTEQPAPGLVGDGPRELPLDLIDEDPNQPRTKDNPGFAPESIAEIGGTIKARGVKSPISVRENKDAPGRYLINHGARRYRGSKWAGRTTIPAFIDNDYNEADQVIENLQRNELTAREIADFIGRELAKRKKKSEIAKEIGKSPAFVTQHVTLLDLPEPVAEAFNSGRAKDVTVINELVTAYKRNPNEVAAWLADDSQELTRGSVKLLREFLEDKRSHEGGDREPGTVETVSGAPGNEDSNDSQEGNNVEGQEERSEPHPDTHANGQDRLSESDPGEPSGLSEGGQPSQAGDDAQGNKDPGDPYPTKLKKAIVQVTHENRRARLLLNRRPSTEGWAWLKHEDDGHEFEADLGTVQLVAVLEG